MGNNFLEQVAATLPRDQVENFIRGGYAPLPWALEFHKAARQADAKDGPEEIGAGGARGGGKSVAMMAQLALDDCQRLPGLKALLLRKVGGAVRESVEDMRLTVLQYTPHDYVRQRGVITFPNGSRIVLGHYNNESDIDKYLGLEYDAIGVEEATTLTGMKYRTIRTCARTSKDWRPRVYSNANPGGVGHAYYKQKFLEGDGVFVPSTFRDNPYLNEGYERVLNSLTGWRKEAWRDGNWDIASGQYFTTFSPEHHVIEPIEVAEYWDDFWLGVDYGFVHPTAVLLFGKFRGMVYIIGEHNKAGLLPKSHDKLIRRLLDRVGVRPQRISRVLIGADAYRRNKDGETVADDYKNLGWPVKQAEMSAVQGAITVLDALGDPKEGVPSGIKIFNTCTGLIDTIPRLQHDPSRPERAKKVDVNDSGEGGDDLYDALRYGLSDYRGHTELEYTTQSIEYGWRS